MNDKEFKIMRHRAGNLRIMKPGKELSKGYLPDVVIEDSRGKIKFILEHESKSDRKAFLGDLFKAEKYGEEEKQQFTLVIVMTIYKNTTLNQIGNQLEEYYKWLKSINKRKMSVKKILLISTNKYSISNRYYEALNSTKFEKRCRRIT